MSYIHFEFRSSLQVKFLLDFHSINNSGISRGTELVEQSSEKNLSQNLDKWFFSFQIEDLNLFIFKWSNRITVMWYDNSETDPAHIMFLKSGDQDSPVSGKR